MPTDAAVAAAGTGMMSIALPLLLITFLWGLMPILQKDLFTAYGKHNILMATNLCYLGVLAMYLHAKGWSVSELSGIVQRTSWTTIALFVAMVICCMFWSNIMFANLMDSHDNARDITLIVIVTSCYPIVTGILSSLYYRQPLGTNMWAGMVLVCLGLALSAKSS